MKRIRFPSSIASFPDRLGTEPGLGPQKQDPATGFSRNRIRFITEVKNGSCGALQAHGLSCASWTSHSSCLRDGHNRAGRRRLRSVGSRLCPRLRVLRPVRAVRCSALVDEFDRSRIVRVGFECSLRELAHLHVVRDTSGQANY